MTNINELKKSFVIGLYRQGNPSYKIALMADLTEIQVERILEDYLKQAKKKLKFPPINLN